MILFCVLLEKQGKILYCAKMCFFKKHTMFLLKTNINRKWAKILGNIYKQRRKMALGIVQNTVLHKNCIEMGDNCFWV